MISTHTSRVGCDSIKALGVLGARAFLLTHPVWDVTFSISKVTQEGVFLLTHPVWDVTSSAILCDCCSIISTHTSRVGCDLMPFPCFRTLGISTHTSRVGCDGFITAIHKR